MTYETGGKKQLLIVTGLSGAGKSTCLGLLEDIGYYCVDNIPQELLWDLMNLFERLDMSKMVLVVDARWKTDLQAGVEMIQRFKATHTAGVLKVLFLEAQKEVIVNRFALTRRKHPLADDGNTHKATEKEIALLAPFKEIADYSIDTSKLNTHQLRENLKSLLEGTETRALHTTTINFTSFGFKYGAPLNADFMVDCRFLPNPHYVPELAALSGLDQPVSDYLDRYPIVQDYMTTVIALLEIALKAYEEEGRWMINVSVGCTGGQHRSVYLVQKLADCFSRQGYRVKADHRDIHFA